MSPDPLSARDEAGVRVLSLSGEIDIAVAPGLQPDLFAHAAAAVALVLDLTGVSFFDSSGVRLVDHLARECARLAVPLRVVAPKGEPSRMVLDLVGVGAGYVADDLDTALRELAPEG